MQLDLPARSYPDSPSVARLIGRSGSAARRSWRAGRRRDLEPAARADRHGVPCVHRREWTARRGPARDRAAGPAATPAAALPPGGAPVTCHGSFRPSREGWPGLLRRDGIRSSPAATSRRPIARARCRSRSSTALAERHFAGADPIGRRIRMSPVTPWMTIVGVVGNIRRFARDDAHRSEFYRPFTQAGAGPSDGPGTGRAVTR